MPQDPLTDPEVLSVVQEYLRPLGDHFASAVLRMQLAANRISADAVMAKIPNDATPIGDSNQATHPITGADVNGLVGGFAQINTLLTSTVPGMSISFAQLISRFAINPLS